MYDRSYYLEPDGKSSKSYVLLAKTLMETDRVAIVHFALRNKTRLAALRVKDFSKRDVMVIHTLLWPDEIRDPDFPVLDKEVEIKPAELKMAGQVVESMTDDFHPERYEDTYQEQLKELVEAKLEGGEAFTTEEQEPKELDETEDVSDLLAKLEASVKARRGGKHQVTASRPRKHRPRKPPRRKRLQRRQRRRRLPRRRRPRKPRPRSSRTVSAPIRLYRLTAPAGRGRRGDHSPGAELATSLLERVSKMRHIDRPALVTVSPGKRREADVILDRFRLDDQVAVVTGAGRGLGAAMALAFAEAGADVVIASRTQSQLEEVAEQIKCAGRRAHVVVADLAHPEDTAKLAGAAVEAFGKLDIVVNNVGGTMPNTLLTTSTKDLKDAFTFNVATAHALTSAAVPLMLEHSGGGSIINITSTMGRLAGRGFAAYGTAKAALAHYTRLTALDLCPRIRVNAIAPGSIVTSALDVVASNDELREPMEKATPMRRLGRSPRHRRCRRVSRVARGQFPDRQDARSRRRPYLPQPRPAHPGSVRRSPWPFASHRSVPATSVNLHWFS